MRSYQVAIVGESGTGKTALLGRFVDRCFTSEFVSTIGVDFKMRAISIPGSNGTEVLKLRTFDTSGQGRFRAITNVYITSCKGIILVFDVTNRDSFLSVAEWHEDIKKTSPDVPVFLCGNKVDLRRTSSSSSVSREEGQMEAKRLGCEYIETSAKTGAAVDVLFSSLAQQLHLPVAADVPPALPSRKHTSRGADKSAATWSSSSLRMWLRFAGQVMLCLPRDRVSDEPYADCEL